MKLFCCSDIHSFLRPLKKALDEAGFDKDNPDHYLLVCGDCFDRGPESEELLYFLMSLERKILVKGNHDLLLRDCCMREFPYSYDVSNGTVKTINDIGGAGEGYPFDKCCENTWNRTAAYRDLLVNYFETENYIFVHSWVPLERIGYDRYTYIEDWRNADDVEWNDAMWGNPFAKVEQGLNQTGKVLIFGHWHTSWPRHHWEGKSEFEDDADFSPYFGKGFIALDAATALTNQVNVVVLEDSLL